MYQSQSYQTANYRGNQPGHDAYLRSDSTSASSFGASNNTVSQYRGYQKPFQPTGFVQSTYGQNQGQLQNQMSTYGTSVNPQSYHTANYRGDQPGHDNYLRADSTQPSNFGTSSYGQTTQSYVPTFSTSANYGSNVSSTNYQSNVGSVGVTSGYGQSQSTSQFTSPQSYHTANYRGDQPGHDNYLRADSTQPAQSQFGGMNTGYSNIQSSSVPSSFGTNYSSANNFNTGISNVGMGMGTSSFQSGAGYNTSVNSGISSYGQSQNSFVNPQSYHTANYRGDQPGHDNYLRADSTQPAQSQFGSGMNTGFNTMNRSF